MEPIPATALLHSSAISAYSRPVYWEFAPGRPAFCVCLLAVTPLLVDDRLCPSGTLHR